MTVLTAIFVQVFVIHTPDWCISMNRWVYKSVA